MAAQQHPIASPKLDGSGLHIGLVYTRQCHEIVDALVTSCRAELLLKGVTRSNIHELQVSLPFEIPYAMKRMMEAAPVKFDAVVVIGCMVKGATMSFEFVAEAVTRASMKIGMKLKTPVTYGVLTCLDEQQARECAGLTAEGKTRMYTYGVEWAQSAIEMAHINNCAKRDTVANRACDCHGKSDNEQQKQQREALSCESKEEGDDELAEATGKIELSSFKRSAEQKGECGSSSCMKK